MPTNKSRASQLEKASRLDVIEELFYDFNKNRISIYWTNLIRGIFFGVGSVIGATIFVTLSVAVLNNFTDIPGGIGDFVRAIVDRVQNR